MKDQTKYLLRELKIDKELTQQEEIELWIKQSFEWQHKFNSQCSKMGGYKAKVTKEVREREKQLKWKEDEINRKIQFLENNNYESLEQKNKELFDLENRIRSVYYANRRQLQDDFEKSKEQIINELSKELIRWTEENDIDNQRSQGYLIGINKAKKIIKEEMIFNLKELPEFKTKELM